MCISRQNPLLPETWFVASPGTALTIDAAGQSGPRLSVRLSLYPVPQPAVAAANASRNRGTDTLTNPERRQPVSEIVKSTESGPPTSHSSRIAWAVAGTVYRNLPLWAWRTFAVGILLLLYVNVLSRGISYAFPDFGTKLSKTPFLAVLAHYEETKNLTLAHPFALLFMIVVFVTWELLLRMLCGDTSMFDRFDKPEMAQKIMACVGAAVLAADCWFYYSGITNLSWKGSVLSVSALLATVGFIAVNIAVTMFSVFLSPRGYSARKENAHA